MSGATINPHDPYEPAIDRSSIRHSEHHDRINIIMSDLFDAIQPAPAHERHCVQSSALGLRGTLFDARETLAAEVSIDTVVRFERRDEL